MAKYKIHLSEAERSELDAMLRKYKTTAQKYIKAGVIIQSDEASSSRKLPERVLAERYSISERTVQRIRRDFCLEGMGVFEARPRATRSDKVYDARVEAHLLAASCSEVPEGQSRWTLQMLCDELVRLEVLPKASRSSVCQLLKKTR